MDKDNLFSELERIARAFQAPDPGLELDIQKVINQLRAMKSVPEADIMDLEEAMHHPEKLDWKPSSLCPPSASKFVPTEAQLEWFREFIRQATEGMIWELPATGQRYRISKEDKTFTLIKDMENDHEDWHDRNRTILEKLGWRMVDSLNRSRGREASHKDWQLVIADFPIDAQENQATPGRNHLLGSRGQDAFAYHLTRGVMMRLGHRVGRAMFAAAVPGFGVGKAIFRSVGGADENS